MDIDSLWAGMQSDNKRKKEEDRREANERERERERERADRRSVGHSK